MENKKIVKKVVKKPVEVKKENSFIDKLKKNWKNIFLILLLLFSMSKCTSSCSKSKKIDKLNYQIEVLDSTITANGIEMDKLNIQLDNQKTSLDSYKGIATGNQQELVNKVSELTEENNELKNNNKKLNVENNNLRKQLQEMNTEIDKLKNIE